MDLLLGFVVIVVTLLVAALALRFFVERSRIERMRSWAGLNGWGFQSRSSAPWTDLLPGRNRFGLHATFAGQFAGRWVTVAEYVYRTTETHHANELRWRTDIHSGPRRDRTPSNTKTATHRFVVTVVRLNGTYPAVSVHHRGVSSRVGRALVGYGPIASGNVAFDSRFHVTAPDSACAASLIGPALIAAHTAEAVPTWTLLGPDLITCAPIRNRLDPGLVPAHAASLVRVADLLGR